MSVRIAKSAGFCFGVSRAVELVEQAAAAGKKVATLGPIIHNRHVVDKFEKMGVRVIEQPEEANADETVIIRSHGVTREVVQRLEATGAEIIDATCPFVKRIHSIVSREEEKGRLPVIIGTPTHPEVEGIAGWCSDCRVLPAEKILKNGRTLWKIPRIRQYAWFHRRLALNLCGNRAVILQKNSLLT